MLKLSSFGTPVARWFTQVDPADPGLHPRYRWSSPSRPVDQSRRQVRPCRGPVHAPARRPAARRTLDGRRRPARRDAVDPDVPELRGASLPGRGRRAASTSPAPVSPSRASRSPTPSSRRSDGATPRPRPVGTIETGSLGVGMPGRPWPTTCTSSTTFTRSCSRRPGPALFVTSLRRAAPLVMLNLSMGDQATLRSASVRLPARAARAGPRTCMNVRESREAHRCRDDLLRRRRRADPRAQCSRDGSAAVRRTTSWSRTNRPSGEPVVRLLVHPADRAPSIRRPRRRGVSRVRSAPARRPERIMSTVWRRREAPPGGAARDLWRSRPGRSSTFTSPAARADRLGSASPCGSAGWSVLPRRRCVRRERLPRGAGSEAERQEDDHGGLDVARSVRQHPGQEAPRPLVGHRPEHPAHEDRDEPDHAVAVRQGEEGARSRASPARAEARAGACRRARRGRAAPPARARRRSCP